VSKVVTAITPRAMVSLFGFIHTFSANGLHFGACERALMWLALRWPTSVVSVEYDPRRVETFFTALEAVGKGVAIFLSRRSNVLCGNISRDFHIPGIVDFALTSLTSPVREVYRRLEVVSRHVTRTGLNCVIIPHSCMNSASHISNPV
jgi:hypothetical protein